MGRFVQHGVGPAYPPGLGMSWPMAWRPRMDEFDVAIVTDHRVEAHAQPRCAGRPAITAAFIAVFAAPRRLRGFAGIGRAVTIGLASNMGDMRRLLVAFLSCADRAIPMPDISRLADPRAGSSHGVRPAAHPPGELGPWIESSGGIVRPCEGVSTAIDLPVAFALWRVLIMGLFGGFVGLGIGAAVYQFGSIGPVAERAPGVFGTPADRVEARPEVAASATATAMSP